MKRGAKIGCGIVAILAILSLVGSVAGVQVFLKNYLGRIIQARVIPPARQKLQVQTLEIGDASVNLLGGSVSISRINVGNPRGFKEQSLFSLERFSIRLGLYNLIKATMKQPLDVEVPRVEIRDADFTIIRNEDSTINFKVLADTINAGQAQQPAATLGKEPAAEPVAREEKSSRQKAISKTLPNALLKVLDANTTIRYVDHAISKDKPLQLAIKLNLKLRDIANYRIGRDGTISITGSLATDADLCKTDITGNIAPITDPAKPTFNLAGDIGNVDLRFIRPYMESAGFGCDSLSIKMHLVCKDGIFDTNQSVITLMMTKVKLTGENAGKMPPGMSYLPELTVPLPIEGTIAEPKTDGKKALLKAVLDNMKNNAGSIIGAFLVGGKDTKDKKDGN